MKKIGIVNICVLVTIFLTAGLIAAPDNYNREIKTLISQRVDILNSFYSYRTDYDQAKDDLEKVESGKLLRNDVINMEDFAATDIDQVKRYRVKIKSSSKTSYGVIKGKAEIQWAMETYNGSQKMVCRYYFTGETQGGRTKLTQIKKI